MPGEITIGDQLAVVRAAIAATIAATLDAPLVSGPGEAGRTYIALAGGLAGFGRPLVEELLPLELLMRDAHGDTDDTDSDTLTETHLLLDSLMARLHDTILNPALPFQLEPPLQVDISPINRIYGDALAMAEFAGQVELSAEAKDADALLFDDGEPTPVLQKYRSYEQQVEEAAAALAALAADASADERDRLQAKLERLQGEWIGLGRKRDVEHAFNVIRSAQTGFEDERSALVERFESGAKARRDAVGLTYHRSHLIPTAPLLNEGDTGWTRVTLDHKQLLSAVAPAEREVFGLAPEEVERCLESIVELTFEHLVSEIRRDWLDPEFFTARYWRLANGVELSDGAGGGKLPCLPRRIIFLRNVTFSTGDVGVELISPRPRTGQVVIPPTVPKRIALEPEMAKPVRHSKLLDVARTAGLQSAARVITTDRAAMAKPTLLTSLTATQPLQATSRVSARRLAHTAGTSPSRPQRTRRGFTNLIGHLTTRPRVRDHRDREASSEANRDDVNVSGSISVARGEQELVDRLTLTVVAHDPAVGDPVAVELERSSNRAKFATTLRRRNTSEARSQLIRTYAVRLHRADGDVVAEHLIDMTSGGRPIQLKWKAVSQPNVFAVAEEAPVVHAYEVRVVPKCPNPDESLVWT